LIIKLLKRAFAFQAANPIGAGSGATDWGLGAHEIEQEICDRNCRDMRDSSGVSIVGKPFLEYLSLGPDQQ
jgi:hypothetical protein